MVPYLGNWNIILRSRNSLVHTAENPRKAQKLKVPGTPGRREQ